MTANRIFGFIVTLAWLGLMGALFNQDYPFWRPQEPPAQILPPGNRQTAILDARNRRVGTTWMNVTDLGMVDSMTVFDVGRMISGFQMGDQIAVNNVLRFEHDGLLDSVDLRIRGFKFGNRELPVKAAAKRYGADFACELEVGPMRKTISLPADASEYLGETLRPFSHLKGLRVGQSWRIRIVDPLKLVTSQTVDFVPQMARVTAREPIRHGGAEVPCFRIETEGATAWADDDGTILRQEVLIPILGKWTMVDEPFDAQARKRADARFAAAQTGGQ